jgi:large subunit ribosomal protein L9
VVATAGRLRSLSQLTAQAKNREDRTKTEAAALAERLSTVQVELRRRAADEAVPTRAAETAEAPAGPIPLEAPRLFGSVTSQDLSEALAARGFSVDKKKILLPEPIKTLGVHRVPIRLHPEVTVEVTVTVERQD